MSIEELMELSEDERRYLIMSNFSEVFPYVQNLILKLSLSNTTTLSQEESIVAIQALYLASIEYTRYWNKVIPEGERIH